MTPGNCACVCVLLNSIFEMFTSNLHADNRRSVRSNSCTRLAFRTHLSAVYRVRKDLYMLKAKSDQYSWSGEGNFWRKRHEKVFLFEYFAFIFVISLYFPIHRKMPQNFSLGRILKPHHLHEREILINFFVVYLRCSVVSVAANWQSTAKQLLLMLVEYDRLMTESYSVAMWIRWD